MVQPLAIVLSDRVVVSAQLEQKLEGLDYRVQMAESPAVLPALAAEHKPLVVFADLVKEEALAAIRKLSQNPETAHVPVMGFAPKASDELQSRANASGVKMLVTDSAVLHHLKQLLDQALRVD